MTGRCGCVGPSHGWRKVMKAVILDDDPIIQSLLATVLSSEGYTVSSYSSPAECRLFTDPTCPCALKGECPDVIITDWDMPEFSGLDFVEKLKQMRCLCKNIAMISGFSREEDLLRDVPEGVRVFAKPFSVPRVSSWLRGIREAVADSVLQANRRRYVRYPCRVPVRLFCEKPGMVETFSGVTRNISKGGMRLECTISLASAAKMRLSFTVPEWIALRNQKERDVMVEARTRHSNPATGLYGLQFAMPLA